MSRSAPFYLNLLTGRYHRVKMLRVEDIAKFIHRGKFEGVLIGSVIKKSENLLKVRLCIYTLALVHLVLVSCKLLMIDFTKAEDPSLRMYDTVRWKLITCWFNLTAMTYLPICIYCDMKELYGEIKEVHVKLMNNFRFLIFTSFLFPTTTFSDILFWRLWLKDRELLGPKGVDALVPFWTQHSMHTVSLVVTMLDLVLVPRARPRSFVPGLGVMAFFLVSYCFVCMDSYTRGEYLYPVFKLFNGYKMCVVFIYVIIEHLFYYFGQFILYDLIWGKNRKEKHHTL